MESWNFSISAFSLAKAFTVRTPDTPDSTAVLISAVSCFTPRLACRSRVRSSTTTASTAGTRANSTRASSQRIVSRITRDPIRVSPACSRFSGPWWASSVISKRSVVIRLMSLPVRWVSKKEKDRVWTLRKMSSRISASTRTPSSWP